MMPLYLISCSLSRVLAFSLPIHFYSIGESYNLIILSFFISLIPNIASGFLSGFLSKKIGDIYLVCYSQFFIILFCFLYLILFETLNIYFSLIYFFLIFFFDSLYKSSFFGCSQIIFEKFTKSEISNKISVSDKLSLVLGPVIYSILFSFGLNIQDYILFLSAAHLFILFFNFKLKEKNNTYKTQGIVNEFLHGYKIIKENEFIKFVLLRFFLTNIFSFAFQSIMIVYLKDNLKVNNFLMGIFFSIAALGVLYGGFLFKKIKNPEEKKWGIILFTGFFSSALMLFSSFYSSFFSFCICWITINFLGVFNSSIFNIEKQRKFDRKNITLVTGFSLLIVQMAFIPSCLFTNIILNNYSLSESLLIVSTLSLFINSFFLIQYKIKRGTYNAERNH